MSEENQISDTSINSEKLTLTEQRSLIFHLLYAIDAFDYDVSLESIADQFARGFGVIIPPESVVFKSTQDILDKRSEIDTLVIPLIENWRIERVGTATKLILRLALWELLNTKVDSLVIINEAIELAKCFAEKDAYKFINGVLDEFIKKHQRP